MNSPSSLVFVVVLSSCIMACASSGASERNDGDHADAADAAEPSAALRTYCQSREALVERCNESPELDACARTLTTSCLDYYGVYRDEYLEGLTSCGFDAECNESGITLTQATCISKAQAAVPITPAQNELASAFCEVCGPVGENRDCLDGFFGVGGRTEGGGVLVSGAGFSFSMLTEAQVDRIRQSCVPAANSETCYTDFYDCVDAGVSRARGEIPDDCRDPSAS